MANWPDEKLYVCRNKIQTQKYDTGLPETKKKKISHETLRSISSCNMTIILFCFGLYSNLALQKG